MVHAKKMKTVGSKKTNVRSPASLPFEIQIAEMVGLEKTPTPFVYPFDSEGPTHILARTLYAALQVSMDNYETLLIGGF